MMTVKIVLFNSIQFVIFSVVIANSTLPDYIKVCHRNDEKLVDCMKKSVETLRPYLTKGIPELEIPTIEPLLIGDLIVAESVPGQGISITIRDVKAYGSSNFVLKKLEVIEYGKKYQFDLELPHLSADGIYVVDGRILLIPVKGSGRFRGNFTRNIGSVRVSMDRVVKADGQEYNIAKRVDIRIRIKGGRIQLEDIFSGDRVLSEVVNETINQNFDLLSKEIIPLIEKALSKHFKKVGNKILGRYPTSTLFP